MVNLRHKVVALIAGALACAASLCVAQSTEKIPRVAMLWGGSAVSSKPLEDAFMQGLAALGRKEGVNLMVDRRYANGDIERIPALAAELVQGKPDVIFAPTRIATDSVRKVSLTIPIVFSLVPDPVRAGIAASLARPGGNATGFSQIMNELTGKRLELLKELNPRLMRLGVLHSGDVTSLEQLGELQGAAKVLGMEVIPVKANRKEAYEEAFAAARRARAEALFVVGSIENTANRQVIGDLVVKYRLPTIHDTTLLVEAGGLMSYAADYPALQRSAASYVDRILKGAKPADLPIQRPTEFELVINLKTAKAIGLAIPQALRLRANKVIE